MGESFNCEQALRRRVGNWIAAARLEQGFQTVPWELYADMLLVNEVISEDPCWAGFDEYGQLYTENGVSRKSALNIYQNSLTAILAQAFPKQKGT